MKHKKIIALGMVSVLIMSLAAGCGSSKSVQEQVTENLLKAEDIPDTDYQTGQITAGDEAYLAQKVEEAVKDAAEAPENGTEEEAETPDAEQVEAPDNAESSEEEPDIEDENKLQIVFLGDSIFDHARDGTGVPYLTGEACNARIYNLAIGGTTAGLFRDEDSSFEKWSSIGMLGMIYAMAGYIDSSIFSNFHAKSVFDKCDFSKTDYFVVEYGSNDFLAKIPVTNNSPDINDPYCYYGAVQMGISDLRHAFPDAEVIFVTPHYEQFWGKDKLWLGDCNTVDLGCGTLSTYIAAGHNAAQSSGAHVINAYSEIGIDGYTADRYLEDGIHLTEEGRKLYAEVLAEKINQIELNKAN